MVEQGMVEEIKFTMDNVAFRLLEDCVEVTYLNTSDSLIGGYTCRKSKYISYSDFVDVLKLQNVTTYSGKINNRLRSIAKLISIFYGDVKTTNIELPPNIVKVHKVEGTNDVKFRLMLKGSIEFGNFKIPSKYERYVDANTYLIDVSLKETPNDAFKVYAEEVQVYTFKGIKYHSEVSETTLEPNEYLTKKLESKLDGMLFHHGSYATLNVDYFLGELTESELTKNKELSKEVNKILADNTYNKIDWSGIKWG